MRRLTIVNNLNISEYKNIKKNIAKLNIDILKVSQLDKVKDTEFILIILLKVILLI